MPAERLNFVLDEISRVIRPGGLLIASSPNQASLENRIRLLQGNSILDLPNTIPTAKNIFPHIRLYTPTEMAQLMRERGLSLVRSVLESNNSAYRGTGKKSLRESLYRLYGRGWSTTCVPCIEEMPGIEKLQASLNDNRVVFLAVTEEPRSEVRSFLTKRTIGVQVYRSEQKAPRELSSIGFPTTYIVSGDGEIAFRHSGALNWDDNRARAFLLNLVAQTAK